MTRRKIVVISLPPELEAAAKAHVAALGIGMTEWVRGLIAAELRRAGVDIAPLVARLGEGQGRRSDFDDERRGRALAQLADARKARRAKTREKRIRKLAQQRLRRTRRRCCAPSKPKKKSTRRRRLLGASAKSSPAFSRKSPQAKTLPLPPRKPLPERLRAASTPHAPPKKHAETRFRLVPFLQFFY